MNCHKIRIIYSESRLNSDERTKLSDIKQTIHICCGDDLIPDDAEYDILREKKVCADKRRNCKSPVETLVYKLKKSLVCVACCGPVSEDISEKFKETKTKFSTVLPNCEDEKCLKFMFGIDKGPYKGWICKRPKKQSNKEIINEKKRRHEGAKQRINQAKKRKKEYN